MKDCFKDSLGCLDYHFRPWVNKIPLLSSINRKSLARPLNKVTLVEINKAADI